MAGGGLFVSFDKVSDKSARVNLKAHIRNNSPKNETVTVSFTLKKKSGELAGEAYGKGKQPMPFRQ